MADLDIKICDLKSAPGLANTWADKTISLIDATTPLDLRFGDVDDHLVLKFDDVEDEKFPRFTPPKLEDVRQLLAFTENLEDDTKLLIHCHAGLCRSTAAAFLVFVQHNVHPVDAMFEIIRQRKMAWPNILIVRLGDIVLEKNGELVFFMNEWRDKNTGVFC